MFIIFFSWLDPHSSKKLFISTSNYVWDTRKQIIYKNYDYFSTIDGFPPMWLFVYLIRKIPANT